MAGPGHGTPLQDPKGSEKNWSGADFKENCRQKPKKVGGVPLGGGEEKAKMKTQA